MQLGDEVIRLTRPDIGTVNAPVMVNHTAGLGDIPGTEFASGQPLHRVVIHWVNLPQIFSVTRETESLIRAGRWRTLAVRSGRLEVDAGQQTSVGQGLRQVAGGNLTPGLSQNRT